MTVKERGQSRPKTNLIAAGYRRVGFGEVSQHTPYISQFPLSTSSTLKNRAKEEFYVVALFFVHTHTLQPHLRYRNVNNKLNLQSKPLQPNLLCSIQSECFPFHTHPLRLVFNFLLLASKYNCMDGQMAQMRENSNINSSWETRHTCQEMVNGPVTELNSAAP